MKFRDCWHCVIGTALLVTNAMAAAVVPTEPDVVARIDSQTISSQDLASRTRDKLASEQKSYEQTLVQLRLKLARQQQAYQEEELNKLLDERVLALEATEHRTTPDALLTRVVVPPVSDSQVRAFFDANHAQISQPFETIQPTIRDFLQKQAKETAHRDYLASLRARHHAVMLLEPMREIVPAVGATLGPADAPVTLVEFSDFQCPFCGRFAPVVKQVMDKYPGKIQLVYRHLPLMGLHPNAQKAAEAAVCAQEQGKFWPMHDVMFAEQSALGIDALKEKAKRLGLDSAKFDSCLDSGKSKDTVSADAKAAEVLGIGGTPASFVNGRFVDGAVSVAQLSALIEDELQRRAPAVRR